MERRKNEMRRKVEREGQEKGLIETEEEKGRERKRKKEVKSILKISNEKGGSETRRWRVLTQR